MKAISVTLNMAWLLVSNRKRSDYLLGFINSNERNFCELNFLVDESGQKRIVRLVEADRFFTTDVYKIASLNL